MLAFLAIIPYDLFLFDVMSSTSRINKIIFAIKPQESWTVTIVSKAET